MNKKVSIIVPIYNKEKFLEKCIQSIINQTYENIEILLINDGSTDYSEAICKKYINMEKIKYISIKNGGVSKARNIGIQNASGDYIVFIDADDYVDKYYIESLYSFDYDLVVEGYFKDTNGKKEKFEIMEGIYSKENILSLLKQKEIANIFSVPYLKLFDLNIIRKNNLFFNTLLSFGEDFDFVLRYIKNIKKDVLLKNESHYFNRIENESLSRSKIPNIWNQLSIVFNTVCELYSSSTDRDYFFLRFLKISLLNSNFKKYSNFKKGFNEIYYSEYFKNITLKNFKFCSIDWCILLLFKLKFRIFAFAIFSFKRK